jgi:hypothetical protein
MPTVSEANRRIRRLLINHVNRRNLLPPTVSEANSRRKQVGHAEARNSTLLSFLKLRQPEPGLQGQALAPGLRVELAGHLSGKLPPGVFEHLATRA